MNATKIRSLRAQGNHEEALHLSAELAKQFPHDAELRFETACVNDFLGHEASAIPHYQAALAGSLSDNQRLQALVGLGSTLRTLGQYQAARDTLTKAVETFPDSSEAKVFWAMALHNCGESKTAIETLLRLLASTSSDTGIVAYKQAIEFYAQDIGRKSL